MAFESVAKTKASAGASEHNHLSANGKALPAVPVLKEKPLEQPILPAQLSSEPESRSFASPAIGGNYSGFALTTDQAHTPFPLQKRDAKSAPQTNQGEFKPAPKKQYNTGLPDDLKTGIENLSGYDMSDVSVHYNSAKPAQLQALAYARGNNIHLGPGQERHLPHEAWHVVQQKQGRVNATIQPKGLPAINDDNMLEKEADYKGAQATQFKQPTSALVVQQVSAANEVVQRITGFEIETFIPLYRPMGNAGDYVAVDKMEGWSADIGNFLFGGVLYGQTYGADPEGHFTISADHNHQLSDIHTQLLHTLVMAGFIKLGSPFRGMAIAEYITAPIDESQPGAQKQMHDRITYTNEHIKKVIAIQSGATMFDVPDGNGILSGVPAQQIKDWARRHTTKPELIITAVDQMVEVASRVTLNMQKTTGVLPMHIPALYEQAQGKLSGKEDKGSKVMSAVMQLSTDMAGSVIGSVKMPDPLKPFEGAIAGFLTYLATHVIADNLSVTNLISSRSIDKNLFPYFPKVPLSTALQAMPSETLKPDFVTYWEQLIEEVINRSFKYNAEFWQTNFKLTDDLDKSESKIFGESSKIIDATVYKTNTLQTLKKLVSAEKPEVQIGVQKNLPGLDTPHPQIEHDTGQKAIPLEDRYFNQKYGNGINTDNVVGITNEEFGEAYNRMKDPTGESESGLPDENMGRYRDLQLLKQEAQKMIEYYKKEFDQREDFEKYYLELIQKVKERNPSNSVEEKEKLLLKQKELEEKRKTLPSEIAAAQESWEKELETLREEEAKIDDILKAVRFKQIEKDEEEVIALKIGKQKLLIKIDIAESTITKIGDDMDDSLEDAVYEVETELATYEDDYITNQEEKIEGVKAQKLVFVKEMADWEDKVRIFDEVIKPIEEAASRKEMGSESGALLRKKANQVFLEAKRQRWEQAHKENPHAGKLEPKLLKTEYKKSFGLDKTLTRASGKSKKLSEITGEGSRALKAKGLSTELSGKIGLLKESMEALDAMIGKNTTDEIMQQIALIVELNDAMLKDIEAANQTLALTD